MATEKFYWEVEEQVIALNASMNELKRVLEYEVKANNGKLDAHNYNAQGTLAINLKILATKVSGIVEFIQKNQDDSKYGSGGKR